MNREQRKLTGAGHPDPHNGKIDIDRVKELLKMIRHSKAIADQQEFRMLSYLLNMAETELVDMASDRKE